MINKHKSNKIKENSNTVRHLNNGTDHRHSKSCFDQSSPARRTITLLLNNLKASFSPDNPSNMAADEESGYFQTGFWHVVQVVKSRNLFLTPKNMLFTPWLVWSQYGGACSLSSAHGDIALIKRFSVASTPDFIAGWSQLFPGISSRLSNARSETRYDAQCHSCKFS